MRKPGILLLPFYLGGLLFLLPSTSHAEKKPPCVRLTNKICKKLGFLSFACKVHQRVARHPSASQERCKKRLTVAWKSWLQHMTRQEKHMEKLEKMSESYGSAGEARVKAFKKKLSNQILNRMIGMEAANQQKTDPRACTRLRKLICADFGGKAFYCKLFGVATKAKGVKPARCQEMRENWSTQKGVYGAQEKILYRLYLQAKKDKKLQPKYIRMQQRELLRILNYLRS